MATNDVLLDVAGFLDSAPARRLAELDREELRRVATALASAIREDLGREPEALDGQDIAELLQRALPARLRQRDPAAAALPGILDAYFDYLEQTRVVVHAFEIRHALNEHVDELARGVATGANAERRVASKQKPVEHNVAKTGRNDPCFCGSGKKFKKCCGRGA